jgi:peptidoglycan hydrolase-like protein with peptidoglycan-binding domain
VDPALRELDEEGEPDDEVALVLRLADSLVVPDGVRIVARFGDVATCRVRREDILRVHAMEVVRSAKAPRLVGPGLDDDVEAAQALDGAACEPAADGAPAWGPDDLRRPDDLEATGAGVLLAHIDWGLDVTHPDVRHPDGRTRILALWDQGAPYDPARPNIFGYGRIHRSSDIDRALQTSDPYAALGYDPRRAFPRGASHGMHTIGISGGNGRAGGPSGVAPQAMLAFVDLSTRRDLGSTGLGDSAALLESLDFLARLAREAAPGGDIDADDGRALRLVVNASLGCQAGEHDGKTLTERAMDAFLLEAPGRAIVQSAGNYFGSGIHASGVLRPGARHVLRVEIGAGAATQHEVDLWYPGVDRVGCTVVPPDGASPVAVQPGHRAEISVAGRVVGRLYHRLGDPNNGDNEITLFLDATAPAGAWQLHLEGVDVVDGRFHAWIERGRRGPFARARFADGDDRPGATTGTICNGWRTLAVGAYDPHSDDRPLAPFSSQGPTRDGRDKPDLVAPGVRIVSARSRGLDDAFGPAAAGGSGLLACLSGTSMAAPQVAGTVALMFEVAGRPLHINETRRLLLANVVPPAGELDPVTRARMGCGYLDVRAAVAAAARLSRPDAPAPAGAPAAVALAEAEPAETSDAVADVAAERASTAMDAPPSSGDAVAVEDADAAHAPLPGAAPEAALPTAPEAPAPPLAPPAGAAGLPPPLVLLPEFPMNEIDEACGCGYIDAHALETAPGALDSQPIAWPRAEAIDEAAWMAEADPARDVRGRWHPSAMPFQIQLPIGGGAPALAMPIGGRNSPFAFSLPLGGAPAPAAPPAPTAVAPAPMPPQVQPPMPPGPAEAPRPPMADPGWAPAVPAPADPAWTALPGFETPVAVATDLQLFAAPENVAGDDDRLAPGIALPARLHPVLLRATDMLGAGRAPDLPRHSAQWLRRLLDPRDRDGVPVDPFGPHSGMPSATTLFNVFVHGDRSPLRSETLRPYFARRLQVLARPGDRIASMCVEPGDLLVRVAPGQGWGHVAVVAAPVQCSGRGLQDLGWIPEDRTPHPDARYVHVVEVLPRIRRIADRFARRIAGADGRLPRDSLMLRPSGMRTDRAFVPLLDEAASDWAEWESTDDLPDAFFTGLLAVSAAIGTQAEYLLGVMKAESDIRADAVNPHGHATGLIQFMPDTQRRLGWTAGWEAFSRLSAVEQLPFVERYFRPYARYGLNSTGRLYQATFLPATLSLGSDPGVVIADSNGLNAGAYRSNSGLDHDHKGTITVGDLSHRIDGSSHGPRWREALARLQAAAANAPGAPSAPPARPPAVVPSPPAPAMPGGARPVVRRGASGVAVAALQARLNGVHASRVAAGADGLAGAPLDVDGAFGSHTDAAVRSFQRMAFPGDPAQWDGVVGPRTWAALDQFNVGPLPPSPAPSPIPVPPPPPGPSPAPGPGPAAAVTARTLVVPQVGLLSAHRGTAPDLILRWNDMAAVPDAVDVVVHLHGHSGQRAAMRIDRDKLSISGLDFEDPEHAGTQGRTTPTLLILPRGNSNSHDGGNGYDFPALVAPGGLEQLIALSLALFAQQVGSAAVRRGRLILTAHSGGGSALMGLLGSRDPDEVQVFDALYGAPDALIAWMRQRLGSSAGTSSMRVIHGPTTAAFSRQVAQALDAVLPASDPGARRWRVENTGTAHGQIPRRYGWRLLADAGSDLPGTSVVHPGGAPSPQPSPPPAPGSTPDLVRIQGIEVARQIGPSLQALLAAAQADGLRLGGGGYRSPAQQIALRRQHCGTSDYDIYERPSNQCHPPTARPGHSNHERGLAIDFTSNGQLIRTHEDAAFRWLADNAERFGFRNLPSEPWHWSVDGR